jgi:uncharacterized protein (TIGR02391 family)
VWNLLHPRVVALSGVRFNDGHYADAVEAAFKGLNAIIKDHVKLLTGQELDGATLMTTAFSVNRPLIALDDLTTQSGKDIQQGYMQIFAGAMTGIRNPKAHCNLAISPERALQLLMLASLLWVKFDERPGPAA